MNSAAPVGEGKAYLWPLKEHLQGTEDFAQSCGLRCGCG